MYRNLVSLFVWLIIPLVLVNCSSVKGQSKDHQEEEFIRALNAGSRADKEPDDFKLFGQFLGEWEFDWVGYNEDGTKQIVKGGEWIFSPILEGRVIQDVWILPGRKFRNSNSSPEGEYGTTLRLYDNELKKWRVVWIGPIRNRIRNFIAEETGSRIVLTENPPQKTLRKWIFSDIKVNSFMWHEEISEDGGATWKTTQEFLNKRKTL